MKSQDVFELRILRGIHAGARAVLPDQPVVLGSDLGCDFILSDEGISAHHLKIQSSLDGFSFCWLNSVSELDKSTSLNSVLNTDADADADLDLDTDTEKKVNTNKNTEKATKKHINFKSAVGKNQNNKFQKLEVGTAISIGKVLLAIQASNNPWPDEKALQNFPILVDLNIQPDSVPINDEKLHNEDVAVTEDMLVTPLTIEKKVSVKLDKNQELNNLLTSVVRPFSRKRNLLISGIIVFFLVSIFSLLFFSYRQKEVKILSVKNTENFIIKAQQQAIADIADIVKAANLESRVNVSLQSNGRVLVKATLLTDTEAEALGFALTRIRPPPALKISTERDIEQNLQDAVDRQIALIPTTPLSILMKNSGPIVVINMGGGLFRLDGHIVDDIQRDQLLDNLQIQLQEPIKLESALLTPVDLTKQLTIQLQLNDLDDIRGEWINDHVEIKARLSSADINSWEQLLLSVEKRFKLPLKVLLDIKVEPPVKKLKLPFELQSVVGGNSPYVVLQGGIKIMPDGSTQGWRLVSIDPSFVTFENVNQKRISITR
jgi:hypothetical protein